MNDLINFCKKKNYCLNFSYFGNKIKIQIYQVLENYPVLVYEITDTANSYYKLIKKLKEQINSDTKFGENVKQMIDRFCGEKQ